MHLYVLCPHFSRSFHGSARIYDAHTQLSHSVEPALAAATPQSSGGSGHTAPMPPSAGPGAPVSTPLRPLSPP